MEEMTDLQFEAVLKMVSMIVENSSNIDEAKEKIASLICSSTKLEEAEVAEAKSEAEEFKKSLKRLIEWCAKKNISEKDTVDLIWHIVE